ncbi:DUF4339 domain-containing protein [Bradyrhizobium tropiciagri]|uniref:DUF4339 domain-containing protein n=1 Tax=Bradyrhizobium tropiciagri TaxID=312253 RepID=UPI00067D2B4C|nr:DUF4339 domain-containing protein [Bradyrhizobium tropiciagri]
MSDVPADLPNRAPSAFDAPSNPTEIPPHPLDGEWFIHLEGKTYGPYAGHRLAEFCKEGRIDGATQVLAVGTQDWKHASEDPRLSSIFRQARMQPQAPPPITAAAGATVVQVTNQMAPQPIIFMDDGLPFGPKSAGVALLLSLFICGAGQMYCGKVGKGLLMLFGA